MSHSRPGIVDLRDLDERDLRHERAITAFLARAGLRPEGGGRAALVPPPVLLVIAPLGEPERLERHLAWLGDAERVIVLLEPGEASRAWPREPNLEYFDASEHEVALRHALDLAAGFPAPAPVVVPPPLVYPPGPDFELHRPHRGYRLDQLLAARIGAGARLLGAHGPVDLRVPPARVEMSVREESLLPDGRVCFLHGRTASGRWAWAVDEQMFEASAYTALAWDAHHPIGWAGIRTRASLFYRGRRGFGLFTTNDHDHPCGTARKPQGSHSEARGVEMAADLSAAAYRFDIDVLVARVPIVWRGAGGFDVADFPRDDSRALYFRHDPVQAWGDDLLDDDARNAAPDVVMGDGCYAVDCREQVVRIVAPGPGEGVAERLDRFDGFSVLDRAHRERRREPGRLLGGSSGFAVIERDGRLLRQRLSTGETVALPRVEGAPWFAAGVPGAVNVLLVFRRGEQLHARLI